MKSKLISIALGMVALSATFASAASASPVLTENGVAVPVGATVQATNIGVPRVTGSLTNYECMQSLMHGNVVRNSGTRIEIEFSSFSLSGCTSPFGGLTIGANNLPWCWKTTETADSFELRGGNCSEAPKPLTLLENSCPTTRTAITGAFKTSPEDFQMMFAEQEFVPESGFNCQKIKLDINYTVETAESPFTALTIS